MFKEIYKKIEEYDTIVIARHVGVDPDALASQLALRDAIKLTFPGKKVLAIGTGSAKFYQIGRLDRIEKVSNALLIVVDTPDKKRVDSVDFSQFSYMIKIDHHPFVEKFCDLEYIEDTASSAAEIIMNFILSVNLECNKSIAETLYLGLVSDSNRFLFDSCNSKTFGLVSIFLDKYNFELSEVYRKLYLRPMNEVRLEGYIALNMIVTDNGLGYIKITNEILNQLEVDSASAGNMINNFNFIKEVLVWATITEDVKNDQVRVSIRSRGPEINEVAEKYNGGGHKFASGAKLATFTEAMHLMQDLDDCLIEYNKIVSEEK
ncbi:MAG: bifunctional oligoribonuclease/PAP phosphatase NrnA [Mycoplasmatota bacterium]|nr:bifunctional oligoribonuclease/PAP phosphatase NrnA [Mycoplasmatota bacterium]